MTVCEYSDLPGDVNNDGVLNALAAAALLKHIAGISGEADMLFADFNGDGSVNAMDASAILKKISDCSEKRAPWKFPLTRQSWVKKWIMVTSKKSPLRGQKVLFQQTAALVIQRRFFTKTPRRNSGFSPNFLLTYKGKCGRIIMYGIKIPDNAIYERK